MNNKTKRYIISTIETFGSAFLGTFIIQIENVLNSGIFPSKEIIISSVVAGAVSGTKLLIKTLRENITK